MTKSFVSIIFILFFINSLYSQDLVFAKSAGSETMDSVLDQGNDIITDSSGNIYITGIMSNWTSGSVFGQGEVNQTILNVNGAFIAKYDFNGLLLWAKQIEANNYGVVSNAITLDANNNIYITGYFSVEVTFGVGSITETKLNANSASRDAFFAKYSQDGDFIWAKSFGGINDDAPGGTSIKVDSSHNIYVSGAINDVVVFGEGEPNETTVIANIDMFISKYTENGNLIWVRNAGGSNHASAKNMDLDSNDNIYIIGNFFYDVIFAESEPNEIELNGNNEQAYIAKYDTNGQFIWAKSPYFYSDDTSNISGDIKVLNDNRIVYTGAYGSYGNTYLTNCIELNGEGAYDAILIQFDSNGNYIWNSTINSAEGDRGLALDVDQAGNIFVTGYYGNNTYINEDMCNEVSLFNSGMADIFISVYDINGQFLSMSNESSHDWEQGSAIDVDNSGNIHITGFYRSNIAFGAGEPNETKLFQNGINEIFIAKYYFDLSAVSGIAYAGENNCIEICSNSDPIDLFDSLLGNPDTGGTWIPALASGSGIFNAFIDPIGVYRYSVTESGCVSDYAEITIDFNDQVDAGEDTVVNTCQQDAPFNLFDMIHGTPDSGGNWSPSLASGSNLFDPSVDPEGIYIYTITKIGCSDVSSEITINIDGTINAGDDGIISVCQYSLNFNLFGFLNGSPDSGGVWTPSLSSGTGIFNPSVDVAGVYTYTVTNGICGSDTSEVTVTIDVLPNAGEDGNLEICINSSSVDLFDSLAGTPDVGGVWSPSLSSGVGLFNPSEDTAGVYAYTLEGDCGIKTSIVTVTIFNSFETPNYNINVVDFSSENSIIISVNSGSQYEYSLDGEIFQENNIFSNLIGGNYMVFGREINGCGVFQKEVWVLGYPKFFTPNNDGYNDNWQIKGLNDQLRQSSKILIFDRYGKLLKQLDSFSKGWDGTFNGKKLPTNDYWFTVDLNDGRTFQGHFTLKR